MGLAIYCTDQFNREHFKHNTKTRTPQKGNKHQRRNVNNVKRRVRPRKNQWNRLMIPTQNNFTWKRRIILPQQMLSKICPTILRVLEYSQNPNRTVQYIFSKNRNSNSPHHKEYIIWIITAYAANTKKTLTTKNAPQQWRHPKQTNNTARVKQSSFAKFVTYITTIRSNFK